MPKQAYNYNNKESWRKLRNIETPLKRKIITKPAQVFSRQLRIMFKNH